jgi:hypothetical protein
MNALDIWRQRQGYLRSELSHGDGQNIECINPVDIIEIDCPLHEFEHGPSYHAKYLQKPLLYVFKRQTAPIPPFYLNVIVHDGFRHNVKKEPLKYLTPPYVNVCNEIPTEALSDGPCFELQSVGEDFKEHLMFHYHSPRRLHFNLVEFEFIPDQACFDLNYPSLEEVSVLAIRYPERIQLSSSYLHAFNCTFHNLVTREEIPKVTMDHFSIDMVDSLQCPLSSRSLPGTLVLTEPVFSKYPRLVQELIRLNHKVIDRPSYDGIAWMYTKRIRFILADDLSECAHNNLMSNVHLILLHTKELSHMSRGDIERILSSSIVLHHAECVNDVVNIIESFGMELAPTDNETAWERYSAIHQKDSFNPFGGA